MRLGVSLLGVLTVTAGLTTAFAQPMEPVAPPPPATAPAAPAPAAPPVPSAAPAAATPPVAPTAAATPLPPPPPHATGDARTKVERCRRPDEPAEGAGAFFIGAGLFDFSSLNHRLRAAGYDPINNWLTLIGGEGHAVTPTGFVMGAHGGALLSPDGSGPDGLVRTFGGGFGMLDLGFAFLRRPPLLLTLTSSIGGYGIHLGIGDGQSANFDDVLKNPRRSSSLSRGGLLVGLALGADGRVSMGQAEDGRRGFFTLGARLGVLYGPPLGNWSLAEGGDATAGPSGGLAGGYGALVIGFGGGTLTDARAGARAQ